MKHITRASLVTALIGLSLISLVAQGNPSSSSGPGGHRRLGETRQDGPGGPGMGGHRPPPPLIAVLDPNRDGEIDAEEIANASKALKSLDQNGDGKLTQDELRPPHLEGGAGPDGPPPRE